MLRTKPQNRLRQKLTEGLIEMCLLYVREDLLDHTVRCRAVNRTRIAVIAVLLLRHILRIKKHDACGVVMPQDMQHRAVIAAAHGIGVPERRKENPFHPIVPSKHRHPPRPCRVLS